MAGFGGGDDQDRLLDEATAVAKEQAFYMKRAIENDNLREALKHASNMISELRTSLLSPKNYYELYMQVFQEMQHLAGFFNDKGRHGRKMLDLYESVQHAGSILPRLYLLATVGAAYIKSKEAPAKEILKDMSELTKGVQHPLRGLFLRYYLSQMVKDKLPDTGSEYEAEGGGNIDDAFDFILVNFQESNRLWVRMQHQGSAKDKPRREKERHDLRVLVGANLVRLSQLEGMTVEYFAEVALPKLIEDVVAVKDTMSQQYLFESMIQVFPDEYHIRTLEQTLASYTKAQPNVDMKPIMVALMKRLADFLANAEQNRKDAIEKGHEPPEAHALTGVDIFSLFRTHLQAILERTLAPGATTTPDIAPPLEVQAAFMQFTLTLYPDKVHYVDIILGSTVDILKKYFAIVGSEGDAKLSGAGAEKIVDLLSHPLKTLSLQVLDMEQYPILLGYLNFQTRKQVALQMVNIVVEGDHSLDSVDVVVNLFNFITTLVMDADDMPSDEGKDKEAFAAEQQQVCKLIHKVSAESLDKEFAIITQMRSLFGQGGPLRLCYTLQPVVYAAMGMISKLRKLGDDDERPAVTVKKIFQFVHKTTTILVTHAPDAALELWLAAAVLADKEDAEKPGEFEGICYEFLTQGLICFEEEISETTKQYQGIFKLVGTMTSLTCLEEENFENISQKIVQHSARLLKKPMQCRAISTCSQLFWCPARRDGKRVLECLQKCLKITDGVVQQDPKNVGLWVESMDRYIYYAESGCEEVALKHIQSLLNLCKEHIQFASSDSGSASQAAAAKMHFDNTVAYIKNEIKNGSAEAKALFVGLEDL